MIFDHRTYTCRPGCLRKQLDLYEKHGLVPQIRHLGQPFLYATTDVGDVNSFVHVWVYDSVADRAQRRAAMQADPEWQAYLTMSNEAGYFLRQENKILNPVAFVKAPSR